MIEHTRLSRFLSQLSVGKSGAAFIFRPDGLVVAAPDAKAGLARNFTRHLMHIAYITEAAPEDVPHATPGATGH